MILDPTNENSPGSKTPWILPNYFRTPEYKMSSVTSSFAQKSGRSKFLLAVAAGNTTGAATDYSAFTITDGPTIPASVIPISVFLADITVAAYPFAAGTLFLDLGRQIVIFDDSLTGQPRLDTFRECAVMSGVDYEGLNSDVNVWVKVVGTESGSTNVAVARTG